MRGTPYYFNGDELGMTSIRFDKIEDYRDVATLNGYQQVKNQGGDLAAFLVTAKRMARDNCRTPFQWAATANAGFTTGTPWLKINPNYPQVYVAAEDKHPDSVLNYFRRAKGVRHQH